jgi:[glutamine synthetase] adenylyltransferase / [glutamine synthetase]-adenylyl-L-tyrosine phosphorylase
VEHRLQEWDDKQTHQLPNDDETTQRLAWSLGLQNAAEFSQQLNEHRRVVAQTFEQIFSSPQTEEATEKTDNFSIIWLSQLDDENIVQLLVDQGFEDSDKVFKIINSFKTSSRYHSLTKQSRRRVDIVLPMMLGALKSIAGSPLVTLERLMKMVESISRRSVYLALLAENPLALSQLIKLFDVSPWIANYITLYPLLLDCLIDSTSFYSPLKLEVLDDELSKLIQNIDEDDLDRQMDTLRVFHHGNLLKVAAVDLMGALEVSVVSNSLSWIAEAILKQALNICWLSLIKKYGVPSGVDVESGEIPLLVIGYGKLGGYEMGFSSDLDLVMVFDVDESGYTSGDKSIGNTMFFNRLGQRLMHSLNTMTATGTLYEIDMRLRPHGNASMLVSSLSAFEDYQYKNAWIWEHQAICRARAVAGSSEITKKFVSIRQSIISQQRDLYALKKEVVDMRSRMRDSLDKSNSEYFDLKQGLGGVTDIEFIVQYLILSYAHEYPDLGQWTDNVRSLDKLKEHGLLSENEAKTLLDAYFCLRGKIHHLALQEKERLVDNEMFVSSRQAVSAIWDRVLRA